MAVVVLVAVLVLLLLVVVVVVLSMAVTVMTRSRCRETHVSYVAMAARQSLVNQVEVAWMLLMLWLVVVVSVSMVHVVRVRRSVPRRRCSVRCGLGGRSITASWRWSARRCQVVLQSLCRVISP